MTGLCSKRSLSLIAVCLQSTLLAMIIHISQRFSTQNAYKASSAVFLTEIGKLVLSSALVLFSTPSLPRHDVEAVITTPPTRHALLFEKEQHSDSPGSVQSDWTIDMSEDDTLLPQARQAVQATSKWQYFVSQVFCPQWWYMALPALLFLVQNNLIYVAARNLSVPVFQITFQLKTLVTALCAVVMLGRRFGLIQWLSLVILGLGVAAIQLSAASETKPSSQTGLVSTTHLVGLLSVVCSCFCSAFAATYFELVLKRPATTPLPVAAQSSATASQSERVSHGRCDSWSTALSHDDKNSGTQPTASISVWARNVQMSLFSVLFGIFVVAGEHAARTEITWGQLVATLNGSLDALAVASPMKSLVGSFLDGFTILTWAVVFIQAVGGLLTALVIKYADNVAKGFALSASVVLTVILSIIFFHYQLNLTVVLGSLAVLCAMFCFENPQHVSRLLFATTHSSLESDDQHRHGIEKV